MRTDPGRGDRTWIFPNPILWNILVLAGTIARIYWKFEHMAYRINVQYIYHLIKTLKILEKNHKKSILSFRSQTSKFQKTGYMGFTASNGYCKFCTIFVLCMLWTLFKCPQPKRQKRSSILSMDYIVCVAKYSMWWW